VVETESTGPWLMMPLESKPAGAGSHAKRACCKGDYWHRLSAEDIVKNE
jgi:hypothetical protein